MKKVVFILCLFVFGLSSCQEDDVMRKRRAPLAENVEKSVPPKEAVKAIKKVTDKLRT